MEPDKERSGIPVAISIDTSGVAISTGSQLIMDLAIVARTLEARYDFKFWDHMP